METPCFFLKPTGLVRLWLRRHASGSACGFPCPNHPGEYSYHDASTLIGDFAEGEDPHVPHTDPRWPTACGCGMHFAPSDAFQHFTLSLYRRADGQGENVTLRDAPPGAMWFAEWLERVDAWVGEDGHALMVKLPNGNDWHVDATASNCDSPCAHCGVPYHSHKQETCCNPGTPEAPHTRGAYVDSHPHKCWVRHGTPPLVTVDKAGTTCGAGAGSIWSRQGRPDGWHGFLRGGSLIEC